MCELLWSDPQEDKGRSPSKRGVGVSFGPDVTKSFLKANKLDLLVRSHEVNFGIPETIPLLIFRSSRLSTECGSSVWFLLNTGECHSCYQSEDLH